MPNGKTHFIAGAVVGATVNLIIMILPSMILPLPFSAFLNLRGLRSSFVSGARAQTYQLGNL